MLRIGLPSRTPRGPADGAPDGPGWIRPTRPGCAPGWLRCAGRPGVVVADDVGTPAEWVGARALSRRGPQRRWRSSPRRAPAQLSAHYQGPVAALRRARSGLLLCPGPGDADLLGVRLPAHPAAGAAGQRVAGQRAAMHGAGPGRPAGRPAGVRDDRRRSEQLERRADLLGGVPGELVTLGLVDDELRVLAAEIGLEDHVDRGADVVLGLGAVDVRAGDVADADRPPSTRAAPRSVSASSIGLTAASGTSAATTTRRRRAAVGSTSISRRLARAAASSAAYSSSSVSASASLSS